MWSNSNLSSVCDDSRTHSSSLNVIIHACGVGGLASGTAIPFSVWKLGEGAVAKAGRTFYSRSNKP